MKIRTGNLKEGYDWITIRKGETIDLSEDRGNQLGFCLVATEGKIGNIKVETKQIDNDNFYKELRAIKGIGKKTAQDIVEWGTKNKLTEEIKSGKPLPFRDDVEEKLKEKYGT